MPTRQPIEAPRDSRYHFGHRDSLEYAVAVCEQDVSRLLGVIIHPDGEANVFVCAEGGEVCGDAYGWHSSRVFLVDVDPEATVEYDLDLPQAIRLAGRAIDTDALDRARTALASLIV